MLRRGKCRQDGDPYATRYGCFLPDLTGLAGRPSAACLRGTYRVSTSGTQPGTGAAEARFYPVQPQEEAAPRAETAMLRTLALAPMFALAIGLPGMAAAEQFPQSAQGAAVRSHDGTVIGRVAAVERNADGGIIAVEIPGLEPGDAPVASRDLIVEDQRNMLVRVRESRDRGDQNGAYDRRVLR